MNTNSKFLRNLFIVFGVAFLIVMLIGVSLNRDSASIDVSDISLKRLQIPAEDNAYHFFNQATNKLVWPSRDENYIIRYLNGTDINKDDLKSSLELNAEAIDLLQQGVRLEYCQPPEVTLFSQLLPYLSEWQNLSKTLLARARFAYENKNYVDATEDVVSLIKFGKLISKDSEILINYLVGVAFINMGLNESETWIANPDFPLPQLMIIQNELKDYSAFRTGLSTSLKGEFSILANTIDLIDSGELNMQDLGLLPNQGGPNPLGGLTRVMFKPNKTLLLFAQQYRIYHKALNQPYSEWDVQVRKPNVGAQMQLKDVFDTNFIGKQLYAMAIPALEKVLIKALQSEAKFLILDTVIELKRFHGAKKVYPTSLVELSEFNKKPVPMDVFDGASLKYSVSQKVVYSVGPNGVDDTTAPKDGSEASNKSVDDLQVGLEKFWNAKP